MGSRLAIKPKNFVQYFEPLILPDPRFNTPGKKRGRPCIGDKPMTQAQHRKRHRDKKKAEKKIGVIDSETEPFDSVLRTKIVPFLFVIYADEFEPIVIWDEVFENLILRLLAALDKIREEHDEYIFYAHNGGKFDFMFLMKWLRGEVSFKGRGIMSAKLCGHELRDSFHVIPEKLANFAKEKFEYEKLKKGVRQKYKDEAISYCISDCKYLLQIIKGFVAEFGAVISIGAAAMARMREHYDIEKLTDGFDSFLRTWFFGGRVECLQDRGDFRGEFRLYDVNSMYPHVMATYRHPVGGMGDYHYRVGEIGPDTVFIDLNCDNRGAFVGRTESGETTARIKHGRFYTTIWEYVVAQKHGLISNVEINFCVDCSKRTDFSKFILPLYAKKAALKHKLDAMKAAGKENTPEYLDVKKDYTFSKLIQNNAYGKLAQNARDFKEHYLTDPGEEPPAEWFKTIERLKPNEREFFKSPLYENDAYWIWSKPAATVHFNNVGTAASITGAARAVLLDAIVRAEDPIYCDTDSIICRGLKGVEIDPEKLGAWDIEAEYKRVVIAGKKLYGVEHKTPKKGPDGQLTQFGIKSKGTSGLTMPHLEMLLDGHDTPMTNTGPTFTKFGEKSWDQYITRTIRATAEKRV